MARFPGSPYDPGTIHPVMLENEAVMKTHTDDVLTAVVYIGSVWKEALHEEAVVTSTEIEDNPAFDRLMDLAVIGLLVERGILKVKADG